MKIKNKIDKILKITKTYPFWNNPKLKIYEMIQRNI